MIKIDCPDCGKLHWWLTGVTFDTRCEDCKTLRFYEKQMNKPAFCNFCRTTTETKEWDCTECGLSKPHPEVP